MKSWGAAPLTSKPSPHATAARGATLGSHVTSRCAGPRVRVEGAAGRFRRRPIADGAVRVPAAGLELDFVRKEGFDEVVDGRVGLGQLEVVAAEARQPRGMRQAVPQRDVVSPRT